MKKRIAIFDMDGTLAETDSANSAAYRAAMRRYGMGGEWPAHGRITSGRVLAMGLSEDDAEAILRAKAEAYAGELKRVRPGPAARALKDALAKGLFGKVVLLTDSAGRRAMETLRWCGMAGCFDEIVCNGGRGCKYANYLLLSGADPADCLVWENDSNQVEAALAAGIKIENITKV